MLASFASLQGGQKPCNSGQIIYELYVREPYKTLPSTIKVCSTPKKSPSLWPSGWDSKTKEKCSFNCSRNCHTPLFLIDAGTGIIDRKGYKYALACGTKFVQIVEALWEQKTDSFFWQKTIVCFEKVLPKKSRQIYVLRIFWFSWQGQARLVESTCNIIVCSQDVVATVFPERCNETASKLSHHLRDSLLLCSHNENRTLP